TSLSPLAARGILPVPARRADGLRIPNSFNSSIPMNKLSRRQVLRTGALGAAGLALAPFTAGWASARPRTQAPLVLRPYPHPMMPALNWAYATDADGDAFESPIEITQEGVVLPEAMGARPFAVNAKW